MENTSDQPSKKTIIMWGIPIIVLIILIIILVVGVMDDEENVDENQRGEDTLIQATDEEEGVSIDMTPIAEDQQFGEEDIEEETAEAEKNEYADEREKSFIMEEGDSLWKIAQKKEVLGDPRKWRTILIQNREKINYTVFSEETGKWKVMVDAGRRLVFKPVDTAKSKTSFDRTRKKRYAVQLMSLNLNQLEKAVNIVKFLIKDGYHAYLYRTREKIKTPNSSRAQYFYRIRVGFYETEREALDVGEEIIYQYEDKEIFPQDYWAVLPSYSELNGELIDFGIQRNKPWIIQLAVQNTREKAINDLKKITSLVDFAYISQKQKENQKFLYRIRVGFFETQREAQKVLTRIQNQRGGNFYSASLKEIRHVMETAPGQSTGEVSIDKIH